MKNTNPSAHDLSLLESIEIDPDITQASLAAHLGVAVGTVNWYLKRLVSKGYVKVKRAQRKKLRYIITPSGVSLRARLTVEYIDRSLHLYRDTRQKVVGLLDQVRANGYDSVRLVCQRQGPDDIVDICRLSCLEHGIKIENDQTLPTLEIRGTKVLLRMPEKEGRIG